MLGHIGDPIVLTEDARAAFGSKPSRAGSGPRQTVIRIDEPRPFNVRPSVLVVAGELPPSEAITRGRGSSISELDTLPFVSSGNSGCAGGQLRRQRLVVGCEFGPAGLPCGRLSIQGAAQVFDVGLPASTVEVEPI